MKKIHLIVVGKYRDKSYIDLEKNYIKRLKSFELVITEAKADGDNPLREALNIQKCIQSIPKSPILLLDERGKQANSHQFAKIINELLENNQQVIFIIGGAHGFSKELKDSSYKNLGLSELTFPHQFARLIFVEQIYRAQTIITGHPYHH